MAMKDVQWSKYLHGPDHDAITTAYHKEWDSLCSSVLRELHEGDPEFEPAKELATKGSAILEFKRVGMWKVCVVVCGHLEDRVRLAMGIVKYLASTGTLCLFQPWGTTDELRWRFYSDSDQSSNTEAVAKRKSQLSHIAM